MVTAIRERPPRLPTDGEILGRASSENFTVASRLLPGSSRRHLVAFYGYARLIDQLGDAYDGDRIAALDWAETELDAALDAPRAPGLFPLIAAAATSAVELGIDRAPFRDLIEANRMDQRVTRYATWDDLMGYCRLSANPVGQLVLAAFEGRDRDPEHARLSDLICSALQVAEHLQDVGEDALAGRVYLPVDDLVRFGVDPDDLARLAAAAGHLPTAKARAHRAPAPLRAVVAFEAGRTRAMLDAGAPLVRELHGRSRLAIAGFVAGGYAAIDAVAAVGYDPLSRSTAPAKRRIAAHLTRLLWAGARP
jgi:squalene synthase HpnC